MLTISGAEVEQLPKPTPAPAVMESHGEVDNSLDTKLHRAWDRISGNY